MKPTANSPSAADTVPLEATVPDSRLSSSACEEITAIYPVSGMHCAACAQSIQSFLRAQPGIVSAEVNFAAQTVTLTYNRQQYHPEDLRRLVQQLGYDLVLDTEQVHIARTERLRRLRRRCWIALACAAPVVVLSMGFHEKIPAVLLLVLTLPVLWAGSEIFLNAWKLARHAQASMDTLVALGTGAAFAASLWATLTPDTFTRLGIPLPLYYEATAVVLAIVLLGRYAEERVRLRGSQAIERLLSLQPRTARRLRQDTEEEVPIEHLQPGDSVRIRPGERVPVDGIVVAGSAALDESALTGESFPVEKLPGMRVWAGTLVRDGSLVLRVEQTGSATVLAQITELVRAAQTHKAPVQRLVDRIAALFVPIVLGIALLSAFGWLTFGPEPRLSYALLASISVLLIACPCALGLATPLAILLGVGRAAEEGLLVRDPTALEQLWQCTALVLDKTGTLTTGQPHVVAQHWLQDSPEVRYALAAVEVRSAHPIAGALVRALVQQTDALPEVENFSSTPAQGVSGYVHGTLYHLGTPSFLQRVGIELPQQLWQLLATWHQQGYSTVCAAAGTTVVAAFALADTLRPHTAEAIAFFRRHGVELHLLTGDHQQAAEHIARVLGIEHVCAHASPQQKADYIRQLQQKGHRVAVVGDGINDAPALAIADVGIAMGSGIDVALESAMLILAGGNIHRLVFAWELSRKLGRVIVQNLAWAFGYNLLALPIAAGLLYPITGMLLTPMLAGTAMALSSISVVLSSLRLRFVAPRQYAPMQRYVFRTSLHCHGCVTAISSALASIQGLHRWHVELEHPDKRLVVEADRDVVAAVISALRQRGYTAELLERQDMSHSIG